MCPCLRPWLHLATSKQIREPEFAMIGVEKFRVSFEQQESREEKRKRKKTHTHTHTHFQQLTFDFRSAENTCPTCIAFARCGVMYTGVLKVP